MIESSVFSDLVWLRHGFGNKSEKTDLRLPQTRQIHSAIVHCLNGDETALLEGDAFATDRKGVVCAIRTADCVPILVADSTHRVVAAIHAGWRGTAAGILEKTLSTLRQRWGTNPKDLRVAIGPSIGRCCYQVGEEVEQILGEWCAPDGPDRWRLDLKEANRHVAKTFGVPENQIDVLKNCTCCDADQFSSFRREGNKRGEQVSFIYALAEL